MAARSLQCVEDASNSSGPIIEDITELCDFCVELTELIVDFPPVGSNQFNKMKAFMPGSDLKSCRLCDMISSLLFITPHTLKYLLRKEERWIFAMRPEEPWHNHICGMATLGAQFAMWADKGTSA